MDPVVGGRKGGRRKVPYRKCVVCPLRTLSMSQHMKVMRPYVLSTLNDLLKGRGEIGVEVRGVGNVVLLVDGWEVVNIGEYIPIAAKLAEALGDFFLDHVPHRITVGFLCLLSVLITLNTRY